ncbi:ABC transporter permease [Paenibacillus sp. TRM 82003]|nr:ABC transporter permease [Paenibacillus sp. TRM 82003]
MRRLRSAMAFDMKLQVRHGFYATYALISSLYIIVLRILPAQWRETAHVVLTFSDPAALGFFFIGGLLLLEKQQHIFDPLFVTPYASAEYVVSKTATLSLLSLASIVLIRIGVFGLQGRWTLFLFGAAATAAFFTLLGLGIASRCRTMNGYFATSTLYTFVFAAPLLRPLGVADWGWFAALPTHATLLTLESAFRPVGGGETLYSLLYLTVWTAGAAWWAHRTFALSATVARKEAASV